MRHTARTVAGVLTLAALVGMQQEARAQAARVSEIERVVRARRGNAATLQGVDIGTPLDVGDGLRTGGRSAAGMRFNDQSGLRIGELTEIVVTGTHKKDTRLLRGRVIADFKTPGVIRSGSAIAAVRGTIVDFAVDGDESSINCYDGRVFVSSADNPIVAGTSGEMTDTSLRDPDLQGTIENYVGGQVRFVDGPFNGQVRSITAFDPGTGTVTFAPALPAAPAGTGPSGYLLVQKADGPVVQLTNRTGTTVRLGQAPSQPYRVPGKEFARLDTRPFIEPMRDGRKLYVYPGTPAMFRVQDQTYVERVAINRVTKPEFEHICCTPEEGPHDRHRMGIRSALQRQFAQADGGNAPLPTPEFRGLPLNVQPAFSPEGNRNSQFQFEPFAVASDERDVLGSRIRYQTVHGQVYGELGYTYSLIDGHSRHDITEGFLHIRGKHGDVIAGRQHLFLVPVNNNDIGTLLGLESTDAVVVQNPQNQKFDVQAGYIFDTRANRRGGFAAGYSRGQTALGTGRIGYSLLVPSDEGRNIGYQGDIAMPVIKNVLDVYGQAGLGTRDRGLFAAGFYVPALYHRYKLDVFAEYANREDLEERVSLRLRREFGRNLLLVGFVEQELGSSFFTAGGGVLWSIKFR